MFVIPARFGVQLGAAAGYGWEWLKWVAFAAMVADHVSVFFLAGEFNALRVVGLVAFPVFCLTFGAGLARTREPFRVADRLLLPTVVAQAAWVAFIGVEHVNMLGVFMGCALVVGLHREHPGFGLVGLVALLVLSPVAEGGAFTPLLVLAGFVLGTTGRAWPALLVGALFALGTPVPLVAFGAVLLVLMPQPALRVPRVPGLLLWGYPLHLVALGFLRLGLA